MRQAIEQYLQEKGFWSVFFYSLTFSVVMALLNSLTLQSFFVEKLLFSLPGLIVFIFPIYPVGLLTKWSATDCRKIIRVLGLLSIFFVSLTKTNF